MEIYYDLDKLPALSDTVVTIGSFDGVHLGHQHILQRVCEKAQQIGGRSVVVTFHPHPRSVVPSRGGDPLQLITTLHEKAHWLAHYGIDILVVVPFTMEFASQSPDEYIEQFLVRCLHPAHIIIGYDHKFGKGRAGDIQYLKKLAATFQYEVEEISPHDVDDIIISSTKIRKALLIGDIDQATKLLGHSFQLSGEVVHGEKIGTKIGFPTANLAIKDNFKLLPPEGIYAVWVHHAQHTYQGMLYVGRRPTLDDNLAKTIEVNILDFQASIYGEFLTLDLVAYLRDDIKFNNLDELSQQLAHDKTQTIRVLGTAL